jgi:hypothetical protein
MGNPITQPLRHLSLRVPWHDSGWDGTVCQAPKLNSACLRLKRIAGSRNDDAEEAVAGKSLEVLDEAQWPCCVSERAMFMAPFEYTRYANHPYKQTSPETHGHFAATPLRHPPYSAPALPFRWMFRESMEQFADEYQIDVNTEREPDLGFPTIWVQERQNHLALLNCFFDHVRPRASLCFFYAKQVPFVEDSRRVLIGVGRIIHVGEPLEYNYERKGPLRSLLWERMIQHSVRPDFKDGFLLPYHAALAHAAENPGFEPSELAAFAPVDRFVEYSYATEHVTNDGAIASLLACAAALHKSAKHLPGPWDLCLKWIDARLAELWKMRGPCPGLGAALCAFGVEHGTFIARELETRVGQNEDPWPLVDKMFANPKTQLSEECARQIDKTIQATWRSLSTERRALLKLISRFEIVPDQAKLIYVQEEREAARIICSDREILENPYRIHEITRLTTDPISVWTIDRGVFPEPVVREKHPLPEPSRLDGGTDARRVRAITVDMLENAAGDGNTLLPRKDVILKVRDLEIRPTCEVTSDLMAVADATFAPEIQGAHLKDGSPAFQLCRLAKMGEVIRNAVTRRRKGKRLTVNADWRKLVDQHLGKIGPVEAEREAQARREKAAALGELADSRFSVLVGPAGTGKTTLLGILCSQADVAAGGVLLLAPTGKARVRMEQVAKEKKMPLKGFTIAQFLGRSGRYDHRTRRYRLSDVKPDEPAETVIVDETSMLTEEMLGALLDALRGAKRIILVGDPRQLPPIGSGRPFVDIISELAPDGIQARFPRVAEGYAELTVRRRQAGQVREDLQLAEWFSGAAVPPGEDDVFNTVVKSGGSKHVGFVSWENSEQFQGELLSIVVKELGLSGPDDQRGFELQLGATLSGEYRYFNRGAAAAAEKWQILSPVRGLPHGVSAINRLIHKRFRSQTIEFARRKRYRKIPQPMGDEEIVYGDKVINVDNHYHKQVWPEEESQKYLANGEIGIAVGQFKTKNMTRAPWELQVEFSSQPGFAYKFQKYHFKEEASPILELAYALTVHKAQGSEFNLVLLALPNPCRLLSRELLYTALTRQRDRVVVLHQGNRMDLKRFASDRYSVTATRLTNLFRAPAPVEVGGQFFEDRLIHRTRRGELVRSKSEVIVADRLADKNLEYVYEKELVIERTSKFPDFTIEDAETGTTFYWEHLGMLHDPDYRQRWEKKLQWYKDHGIESYEDGGGSNGTLIVTRDNEQGGISSQEIESVIRKVILGEAE